MRKEQTSRAREIGIRRDEAALDRRLFAFSQDAAQKLDLVSAFNLYWGGNYGVAGAEALGEADMLRFFDWYIHDYRTSRDRKRIIELFLEGPGRHIPAHEREVLQSWLNTHLSLYRVENVQTGTSTLYLRDVLQGHTYEVTDNTLARLASREDILVARLRGLPEEPHLSWGITLLPPWPQDLLAKQIGSAFISYRQEYATATWFEFLSSNGHLFNVYLLQAITEGRGTTRVRGHAYYDAEDAVRKLQHVQEEARRKREEALREAEAEERRKEGADERLEDLTRTAAGIILPSGVEYKPPQTT